MTKPTPRKKPRRRVRTNGEGNLRQRKNGSWEGRLTVGYDDGGKQITKSVYGPTKAAAAMKLAELQIKHGKGEMVRQGHVPLGAWLADYVDSFTGTDRRENTLHKYRTYLELARPLDRVNLRDLRASDLERLYRALAADGYSHSTVAHVRTFLNNALKRAVRYEMIPSSPGELAEMPRIARPKAAKPMDQDGAGKLLRAAQGTRWAPMLHVAFALGLRRGELLGLRWEDLDVWKEPGPDGQVVERGAIHIRRAVINEINKVVVGDLKTKGSRRTLYLPTPTLQLLQRHREAQALEMAAAPRWDDPGWIFPSTVGTPTGPNNFLRAYRSILKKAGLPSGHRLHDLRHSYASWLIAQGVDPRTLADLLGHADPRFTMSVYVHSQEDQRKRAAAATEGLLGNLLDQTG
ncbi:tyrosine-type recombinase/integrase [Deinococcus pimensis]|uniref:tyrosine-type recombinase/integrase n=1 Tax=Deinococcus pimensis TaxID=309888 RepID=UPI00048229F0|nr:site-specific integrase [Deinococcus pimensis]